MKAKKQDNERQGVLPDRNDLTDGTGQGENGIMFQLGNPVRTYKDRVFRMLFREKKEFLALYNAVNETSYEDTENMVVTTLENAIYIGMKNDVSYLLSDQLAVYEQQSTQNPNMPLRDLFYVANIYSNLVKQENLYGKKQVKIPEPKFIVFYNGKEERAIDSCIADGILEEFLRKNRAEVMSVSIFEYDEELHMRLERRDAKEEGIEEGIKIGKSAGEYLKLISLIRKKLKKNFSEKEIADLFEEDLELVQKICALLREHPEADDEQIYEQWYVQTGEKTFAY
jgi:hypothetical protein